jgi:hypothetical protein
MTIPGFTAEYSTATTRNYRPLVDGDQISRLIPQQTLSRGVCRFGCDRLADYCFLGILTTPGCWFSGNWCERKCRQWHTSCLRRC